MNEPANQRHLQNAPVTWTRRELLRRSGTGLGALALSTMLAEEQAEKAARCALAMQQAMAQLNQKWQEENV